MNKLSKKNFVTFRTSQLTMTCEDNMTWTLDGESGGTHKQVHIRNHKQAVSFIVMPDDKTAEQQLVHALAADKGYQIEETDDED